MHRGQPRAWILALPVSNRKVLSLFVADVNVLPQYSINEGINIII